MIDKDRGEHLPNLREGTAPPPPSWLPRQRRGTTPQMIGRYPDFDVLEVAETWDEATRRVVLSRLEASGPMRFFDPAQERTLRALCDVCTAQDCEPRIPVAEWVDAKLAAGRLDGYRYADMPDDPATWRLVLAGLDESARTAGASCFADAPLPLRETIVGEWAEGDLAGGAWESLNVSRSWSVCMRAILEGFYSHPWAWNEIGFGGPAYPRGYMRMGPVGILEPFETPGATAEDAARVVQSDAEEFE